MLQELVRFSLTQRTFALLLTSALVAVGVRAWLQLPVDAFPDISPVQVKIILKAPGMTAEEIEQQVTQRLETELLGIPRQAMLRSTTKYAITDITLDFDKGTDIYWARQQVSERLQNVRDSLPGGVSGGLAPMSTPLSEMFMFTLENPDMDLQARRELLDWEIRPILRTVPGVADVNVLGGYAKTFQVTPHADALARLGLTLDDLQDTLQRNNRNVGAGRIELGNDNVIVRTEGRLRNLEDIASLVVTERDGVNWQLGDVASVSLGHLARYGSVTRNGVETVEALVIALKDAHTGEVVAGVKRRLAELQPTLPPGTEVNVFYDRSVLIDTAVGTISSALMQAVVLVILLLALFLGNLRAALVVSLSLPLAALATFFLMSLHGLSANLMSLGGLVIAIGLIVDSSVVVVENITTRLAGNPGLPRLHLVYRASKEVATPVVSGTAIVLIVFSPLLTLGGLEGKLFTPVALTIVFAMMSALLLSLTVIPILASILLRQGAPDMPRYMRRVRSRYTVSLERALSAPRLLLLTLAAMLLLSLGLFGFIGKTFMPTLDEGDLIVQLEKSPTISLPASTDLDAQVERALLRDVPEIRQIVARRGADEIGLDPMSLNETDVFMELAPRREWRFDSKLKLVQAMRETLLGFPGINFGFTQPIQMRVSEMLTGASGDVAIKVFGQDIHKLAVLVSEIAARTRNTRGAVDVQSAVLEGGRFLSIDLSHALAARHGLDVATLSASVKASMEGVVVSEIIDGKKRFPLVLAASGDATAAPASVADLAQFPVAMPDGSIAPLGAIAELEYREGPLLIERERGNRFGVVTTNVSERDVVGFVEELDAGLRQGLQLPPGYTIGFGGEFENQRRATRNLLMVVPAALLLILIILFTTFRSSALAGLILGNIPFALMGGVIALFISGQYLSVPASVGFIALLGIAVLNGVVMVSHFEQHQDHYSDNRTLVLEGAAQRLRPILMTATTALFGLMPLVFASGPGAEIQKPLAIVVIGGLVTSTVTTLYLLPLAYLHLKRRDHE